MMKKLIRYFLLGICSVSPAVFSFDDLNGLMANSLPLTDAELGQQRGRYIVSGQAYYFGLLMQIQYLDNAGVAQQASMQVEINPQGVTMTVADQGVTPGKANPITSELYGQVSGLQQRIQVAGEDNKVMNDFVFAQGQLAPLAGGQQITLGQVLVSQDGQRLYSAMPGQFGVQVQLDNGQSQQMLVSQNGSRQLLQAVDISGSQYQMLNLSQLQFEGVNFGKLTNSILAQQLLNNHFNGHR
ncbi:MAG: hypothetical protein ACRDA8_15575 [Shewanella sp.]